MACNECELILADTDKYCPECGVISELGLATEALRKMGELKENEDGVFIIGSDSGQSLPYINPISQPWEPYVSIDQSNFSGDSVGWDPLKQTYTYTVTGTTNKLAEKI